MVEGRKPAVNLIGIRSTADDRPGGAIDLPPYSLTVATSAMQPDLEDAN
ncbi:MAG TPA: hypothetical protein VII73_11175 [Caulobacteraceae bacterium]